MSSSTADRNLLLGIIALQLDFVNRNQLIEGMHAWVLDKPRSLADILVEKNSLTKDRKQLLEALVQEHLKQHDNDPQKSLAAVSSIQSVRQDLEQLADPDVEASLVHVSQNALGVDPLATRGPSMGASQPMGMRFRILRPHAKGGLGQVSVALDEELRREVALKEIHPEHAHREESRGRFLVEAEVTGGLEHPGIVPVYSLGTYADGRPYYAMRFIRGDSLKAAIERFYATKWSGRDSERTLELRKLLGRFVDVCNAIAYAHSRGVLHRDLKPGNIMLGNYGETLVVDWGLAKVIGQPEQTGKSDKSPELPITASGSGSAPTIAGSALGTPAYMSPEQAEGRLDKLGPATDVYSLGATIYQILTGKPPIESQEIEEILVRTVKGEVRSPREINPHIPKPLTAICQKAMSLRPQDRYLSPQKLAEDVERFLADEPVSVFREPLMARVGRVGRKHRAAVLASMAALLLLTVGAITAAVLINEQRETAKVAWGQEAQQRQAAEEAQQKESEQRTLAEEAQQKEADQRKIAEAKRKEAERQLYYTQIYRATAELESGRIAQASSVLKTIPLYQRQWEAWYLTRQVEGTPMVLPGLGNYFTSVAYSPDGNRLVTGSQKNIIVIWDAQTGVEILTLRGHTNSVTSVAFSPNGRQIVSGSRDNTVKVWDAETGTEIVTLRGHSFWVDSVGFSPSGKRILSGSMKEFKVWKWETGAEILTIKGSFSSEAFSPNGRQIVSGGSFVQVWDAESGAEIIRIRGRSVFSVAFSPDGRRVVSGGSHDIMVHDALTGVEILTIRGLTDAAGKVGFSPDGRRIVSVNQNTVKIWDAMTGIEIVTLRGQARVESVGFSPDGRRVVSGGGALKVWDLEMDTEPRTLHGHKGIVESVVFSPDGRQIVSGSRDKTIIVWDAQTGTESQTLRGHKIFVMSIKFSPDGHRIVSASADKTLKVWDAHTGAETLTLNGHSGYVMSGAFSPDGKRIVSGSLDRTIKIWDAETGALNLTLRGHDSGINSVAFSPDGKRIVSGSKDRTIKIWDGQTGTEILTLRGHEREITDVVFSPNGGHIASASWDKTARVWDAETGAEISIVRGHSSYVKSVVFSPDGRRMISASADESIKVWDVETRTEILTLLGHEDDVNSVAFSPDGHRIASGSWDKTVKVWDARTWTQTQILQGHNDAVQSVKLSADSQHLVSRGANGSEIVWDTQTGQRIEGESLQTNINDMHVRLDGTLSVIPDGIDILLIRNNRNYNPWIEDAAFREATAVVYHNEQATNAEVANEWFAVEFHLRQLLAIKDLKNREEIERRHKQVLAELKRQQAATPAVAEKPE